MIFLWFDGLTPLVGLSINLNYTKNESYSDNCNIGKESNEISWIEKIPLINPNCTERKSYNDICSKKPHDINNGVGIQKLLLENLKNLINNYNIGRVGNERT